ncbi:MAG: hypothetical protein B6I26_02085 [Desulfobacteraceae bacterium 4572_130]|nr:MAG: hypothetical protein B6I26_02085 [Desulfobacteraceae bacterium 4572_130]
MINFFSMEFWIGIQFVIDLVFVFLLLRFIKKLKQEKYTKSSSQACFDDSKKEKKQISITSKEIIEMLESLVLEANSLANNFGEQIKEKKRLIKGLNDALDSRIISINLLLSRAESLHRSQEQPNLSKVISSVLNASEKKNISEYDVFDQQKSIIKLYNQGYDVDSIASNLSMPKGEVQLVIDLKKKFLGMENID